ncbi:class I SAM-dependent methyltransferase [Synechococcus sp. CBW1107]|uniref:class I SAM-dependent methyltransferase n=1 Tax=Synechococcus sp. CBW1107 TaxID=2789857 RepID=UPI002AD565F7|nr:class I SAM-dependent methyltransferase [Synechococcus sp. CBW1107]CAK6696860.1 hypothetical protein IFHNHDMJ_02111 [Synechococcus sp. CBW1107]
MTASTDRYSSGQYLAANPDWHASDAPWKARQVRAMLHRHGLVPSTVLEVGCGTGVMLRSLAASPELALTRFEGFDISPQAVALAQSRITPSAEGDADPADRVRIRLGDPISEPSLAPGADLLLVMDVIEHVPDYLGFLEGCRRLTPAMVIHIPLDLHVSSLLRNAFVPTRYTIGHLHYFTFESALATLRDVGFEVIEATYTNAAAELFRHHPSLRRAIANGPRFLLSRFSRHWAARLLGGYSLLVLCRPAEPSLS